MQGSRRTFALRTLVVALTAVAALPANALAGALTPASPASPGADDTQTAYIVVGLLALIVALGAVGGLLAATRGRSSGPDGRERRTRGTSAIQTRVGLGLAGLALIVFIFGIIVTESVRQVEPTGPDGLATAQTDIDLPAGEEPLRIKVSGQQWLWRYEYPDGTFSYYEMVVPVDTAVVLDVSSTDVLHSWWVPALGGMAEVSPGSPSTTWFRADETGSYEGRSTIFSGPGYATMRARVKVVEPPEYEAWLKDQSEEIAEAEAIIMEQQLAEPEDARADQEAMDE